jgi:hypothetical protein
MDYVFKLYKPETVADIVLPFFVDHFRDPEVSISEVLQTYGKNKVRDFLVIPPTYLPNRVADHLRGVAETSMGKLALGSDIPLKYLIYDTTLTLLLGSIDYPVLMSSYLLRGTCRIAREQGTVVLGVSKTHTLPAGDKIARLARDIFGEDSHWFMRIPGEKDPRGKLRFTENRKIPPKLAVTYLFRFSDAMPVFRVDMDRLWWEEEIMDDPDGQIENEVKLFKEIEFISRNARWYGYPCPPAFAHVLSSVTHEERLMLEAKAIEIGKSSGFLEESLMNARRRIGLGE